MIRVTSRVVAAEISQALALLPAGSRTRLGFDLFTADPIFSGLEMGPGITADGRSSRDTAHVCAPRHTRDRRTTLVVPAGPIGVANSLHELGHVLHEVVEWDVSAEPVTAYAKTDRFEAFAEFVTALFFPGYLPWDPRGESASRQRQPIAQLLEAGLL